MPFGRRIGGGRRKALRERALLPAVVDSVTTSGHAVVIDISCTGAKLRGCELPPWREGIMIRVGSVKTFGTIVWRHEDECGVAFDTPLTGLEVCQIRRDVTTASLSCLTAEEKMAAEDWANGLAR